MRAAYFKHKSLLHTILRLNAVFCGFFGLVFLLFSGSIAGWLGIPSATGILHTGILLIGWEVFVSQLVRQPQISTICTWTVILGDLTWVVGSITILLGRWLPLTTAGVWFVALIADVVLIFAIVQYIGLRRQNALS